MWIEGRNFSTELDQINKEKKKRKKEGDEDEVKIAKPAKLTFLFCMPTSHYSSLKLKQRGIEMRRRHIPESLSLRPTTPSSSSFPFLTPLSKNGSHRQIFTEILLKQIYVHIYSTKKKCKRMYLLRIMARNDRRGSDPKSRKMNGAFQIERRERKRTLFFQKN
ncbi:hypothetical protein H6P81_003695 [Aristolochia fimbriata]|uniref:Uncharacterized protein n=1 Tax=Aristolochia fimbriata TaxID=158543 RepID=A0AAV7FDB6_ARIFI|nr:hypothetical protein H6P81_003695 [Aristolochia fimbriata]